MSGWNKLAGEELCELVWCNQVKSGDVDKCGCS